MCDECNIDPVLMLLEELARARGYSLVPIVPPQPAPSEPDQDAEFKAYLELIPLDELKLQVIDLRSNWRSLYKANAYWKERAQAFWHGEFLRWKDKNFYLSERDFSLPRSQRLETELERASKRADSAEKIFNRRFNEHILAYAIANTPYPEEST